MADFTGISFANVDASDIRAAKYIVDLENARRAAQDPPETPLPAGNNAEYGTSYETMLLVIIANAHESYKKQQAQAEEQSESLRDLWQIATDAERQAAIAALGG